MSIKVITKGDRYDISFSFCNGVCIFRNFLRIKSQYCLEASEQEGKIGATQYCSDRSGFDNNNYLENKMNEFETFFTKYVKENEIPEKQVEIIRPVAKAIWDKAYSLGYADGCVD